MPVNALNLICGKIENQIVTDVVLKNVFSGVTYSTKGIWDTGATNSVITETAAKALGLVPITKADVTGIHGTQESNVYFVNITLNNDQITQNAQVTECKKLSPNDDIGMLIGMNIINKGDFVISNHNGHTIMTFRTPSLESIDFVEEIKEHNRIYKIHDVWKAKGIEKCPCGSKKDFRNCHEKDKYNI